MNDRLMEPEELGDLGRRIAEESFATAMREYTRVRYRLQAALIESVARTDGGCRAVALDPPSEHSGRGIVFFHEWPRFRRLLRRRCHCGAQR